MSYHLYPYFIFGLITGLNGLFYLDFSWYTYCIVLLFFLLFKFSTFSLGSFGPESNSLSENTLIMRASTVKLPMEFSVITLLPFHKEFTSSSVLNADILLDLRLHH